MRDKEWLVVISSEDWLAMIKEIEILGGGMGIDQRKNMKTITRICFTLALVSIVNLDIRS